MRTEWHDCWTYPGAKHRGYGQATYDGKHVETHRAAYEAIKGPVPKGLQLDHLCRNRACYNPDHLEAVTPLTNTRRGEAPTTVIRRTGFCPQGHSEWMTRPDGRRRCRPCHIETERLAIERARERRIATRGHRECATCDGPIPATRRAQVRYCSERCKNRYRRVNAARLAVAS